MNVYDSPDGKLKIHKNKISLLGGFLFFISNLYDKEKRK